MIYINNKYTSNINDVTINQEMCKSIPDIPEDNVKTGSLSSYIVWAIIIAVAILGVGSWGYLMNSGIKK